MKKHELQTPSIVLNLDTLKNNIQIYQNACTNNKTELWPMVKTHKSTAILNMQLAAGATGMLCGTLDEAEACVAASIQNVMYAYPVASKENIDRVIELNQKCNFILRLDDEYGAKLINDAALSAGVKINYTIIVDSGLHRFGLAPDKVVAFADKLKEMKGLRFYGISTHPGQVYGCKSKMDMSSTLREETLAIQTAVESLEAAGYELELVTAGSTPTFIAEVNNKLINVAHPGNYVFNDVIQMALGVAEEESCALTVLATVISHPRKDLYIIDAGAKCLGLDQGAHGNESIIGYGKVKNHPELIVYSLSEEVGKIHVNGETKLKVGDKIEIIPNHACSTANLTSYFVCVRNDEIIDLIEVDIRGNNTRKNIRL